MSDFPNSYGILLNSNAKLYRQYFKECCRLLGIICEYRVPLKNKEYDTKADLITSYSNPIKVACLLNEYPNQKSLKKMGWVAELQESSSILHVPYDLEGLQVGCLFTLPSGIDDATGRVFRVISMQNSMEYPSSIACEIAPEYFDTTEKAESKDFSITTTNKLVDLEDDD